MRTFHLTPAAYRRITLLALIALYGIVVTGGAVRLTGSGLGCPDWPTCASHPVVAALAHHKMIELGNRMLTGVVSVAVMLAVLGAIVRSPPRRDLTRLSLGLVAGVLGQIVLGGLTVLFKLAPPFVMAHFLLSLLILLCAVVLHHRAGIDEVTPEPTTTLDVARLGRVTLVLAAITVSLGTVVTSTGPHGGDIHARRFGFALHAVARIHGIAAMVLIATAAITVWTAARSGAAPDVRRRGEVLLAVLVAQAGVGYVQYFTRLPAALVGVHIAGAAAAWVAVVRFTLVLRAGPAVGRVRALAPT